MTEKERERERKRETEERERDRETDLRGKTERLWSTRMFCAGRKRKRKRPKEQC